MTAIVEMLACTVNPEQLIERAGRTAYQSQARITDESAAQFIESLIRRGHLSVLEHASATFRVSGASRAFTHQIVRHRLCSFTQQSQRYVDEEAFDYVIPSSIAGNQGAMSVFREEMESATIAYSKLTEFGVPREDARFVLPNATATEIVITANFRQWRHIVDLRGDRHAQWEVRAIVLQILGLLKEAAPSVFSDYVVSEETAVSQYRES